MRRKMISYILIGIMLLMPCTTMATGQQQFTGSDAPQINLDYFKTNGSMEIQVDEAGVWKVAGTLQFGKVYSDKKLSLSSFFSGGEKIRIRVIKKSGGASQLDMLRLGANVPLNVNGEVGQKVAKLSAKDNDVLSLEDEGIEAEFNLDTSDFVLQITGRIEGERIDTDAFKFPASNNYKPIDKNAAYYNYTMNNKQQTLEIDGTISEVDGINPLFTSYCTPGSGHPNGNAYGWVMNDAQFLYGVLDFTSDNTMDGDKDYASIYIKNGESIKRYRVSTADTKWGAVGFDYTNRVNYQHKTYEFKIALEEIGIISEDVTQIQIAFDAYGTAALPLPAYYAFNKQDPQDLLINVGYLSYYISHIELAVEEESSALLVPKEDYWMDIAQNIRPGDGEAPSYRKYTTAQNFRINKDFLATVEEGVQRLDLVLLENNPYYQSTIPVAFMVVDTAVQDDAPYVINPITIPYIYSDQTVTLLFSEELSDASKAAVEVAIDEAAASTDKNLEFTWGSIYPYLEIYNDGNYLVTFDSDVYADIADLEDHIAEGAKLIDVDEVEIDLQEAIDLLYVAVEDERISSEIAYALFDMLEETNAEKIAKTEAINNALAEAEAPTAPLPVVIQAYRQLPIATSDSVEIVFSEVLTQSDKGAVVTALSQFATGGILEFEWVMGGDYGSEFDRLYMENNCLATSDVIFVSGVTAVLTDTSIGTTTVTLVEDSTMPLVKYGLVAYNNVEGTVSVESLYHPSAEWYYILISETSITIPAWQSSWNNPAGSFQYSGGSIEGIEIGDHIVIYALDLDSKVIAFTDHIVSVADLEQY